MKMDDTGLNALLESEITNALGYVGKLSAQRQKALYYYNGDAKLELAPPEVDGRSSVVSTDVSDVVEWIMPQLCKIFAGSDDAVSFSGTNEQGEVAAEQATAYCNYVFYKQNPGFLILHNWFKDALIEKAGIVKIWWEKKEDVTKERYAGLTDMEIAFLTQDPSVKIAEQAPSDMEPLTLNTVPGQPPTVLQRFDIVLARTKDASKVCIENVPPEEFLISRKARTMIDPGFLAHRVRTNPSKLRAMGYTDAQIAKCTSDGTWENNNQEAIERRSYDDESPVERNEAVGDPSLRDIWLYECYVNVDWDNDGIAELRKITKCGTEILDNEDIDEHPFALLTPVMMPHRVIGRSVADLVFDIQRIKTVLWRQYLDSGYLANNPRYYVDTTKGVNLDDLLTPRPGGLVRGNGPDGVVPLVLPNVGQQALEGIQAMDEVRESRTGVSKFQNITNPETLNRTATATNAAENASNQRIELIARIFAETGVTDLFRKIQKLGSQNAQQAITLRINGQWKPVDPREWKTAFDVSINVGLGSGNKDQAVQHMMALAQAQQQGMAIQIANPKNLYNTAIELTKAMGIKDTDKFWTDPSTVAPPQPQPPVALQVAQLKAQTELQIAQQKGQVDAQVKQAQAQATAQAEASRAQADVAIEQHKANVKAQGDAQHLQNQLALEHAKQQREVEADMRKALMSAMVTLESQRIAHGQGSGAGIVESLLQQIGMGGTADTRMMPPAQPPMQPQQPGA